MKLFKRDIFGKIVKLNELAGICARLRRRGRRISATSGTFDIIHDGHIKYLIRAAEFGDVLIVGVDTDALVRKFKGDGRPKLPGYVRVLNIAAHEHVDIAVLITCSKEMIKIVRPHVFVISEATGGICERIEEQYLVESFGGKIVTLPPMSSLHSTEIIKGLGS